MGAYRYVGTLSIGLLPTIETEILSTALSHAGRVSIPETNNIAKETIYIYIYIGRHGTLSS